MTFHEAREWLYAQEPTAMASVINHRESRHADGRTYISHEMTILRDSPEKDTFVYACASWDEAVSKMRTKLTERKDA